MSLLRRIARFYLEGFRSMRLGRKLWALIILKLIIIFAVLRFFFFTPTLSGSAEQKSNTVSERLTAPLPARSIDRQQTHPGLPEKS